MVDGHVGSVVSGVLGPGNWDITVTCTGITGKEKKRYNWDQSQFKHDVQTGSDKV